MTVRSKEAMELIELVRRAAAFSGVKKLDGPVHIDLIFHPRLTKKGMASKVRLEPV